MGIRFLDQADLPAGNFSRELLGEDYGRVPASVIFVDPEPGRGPRLHRHPYGELFFVLEGEATFFDGAKHHVVGPGGVVLVPPREPHAFRSSGSSRVREIDVHLSSRFVTEWLEQDPGDR